MSEPKKWYDMMSEMSKAGVSKGEFERDWLPLVLSSKQVGVSVGMDPKEIFKRSANLVALRQVDNALNAKSEAVKAKASQDLLDRAGYKPIEVVQTYQLEGLSRGEVEAMLASHIDRLSSSAKKRLLEMIDGRVKNEENLLGGSTSADSDTGDSSGSGSDTKKVADRSV